MTNYFYIFKRNVISDELKAKKQFKIKSSFNFDLEIENSMF